MTLILRVQYAYPMRLDQQASLGYRVNMYPEVAKAQIEYRVRRKCHYPLESSMMKTRTLNLQLNPIICEEAGSLSSSSDQIISPLHANPGLRDIPLPPFLFFLFFSSFFLILARSTSRLSSSSVYSESFPWQTGDHDHALVDYPTSLPQ